MSQATPFSRNKRGMFHKTSLVLLENHASSLKLPVRSEMSIKNTLTWTFLDCHDRPVRVERYNQRSKLFINEVLVKEIGARDGHVLLAILKALVCGTVCQYLPTAGSEPPQAEKPTDLLQSVGF